MMGLHAAALFRFLIEGLKTSSYDTMNRIACGWAPEGRICAPEEIRKGKNCFLNFSPRSRKRLTWIRQACGQGH